MLLGEKKSLFVQSLFKMTLSFNGRNPELVIEIWLSDKYVVQIYTLISYNKYRINNIHRGLSAKEKKIIEANETSTPISQSNWAELLHKSHFSLSQSTVFDVWLNTWAQRARTRAAGGHRSPGIWSRSCAGWRTTWVGREGRAWGSARSSPGKQEAEFSNVRGIHARRLAGAARCNSVTSGTMNTFKTQRLSSQHRAQSDATNQLLVDTSAQAAERYVPSLPVTAVNTHSVPRNENHAAQNSIYSPSIFHRKCQLISSKLNSFSPQEIPFKCITPFNIQHKMFKIWNHTTTHFISKHLSEHLRTL